MTYHPEVARLLLPLLLGGGALLIGLGLWLWKRTRGFLRSANATTGEVVGEHEHRTIGGTGRINAALVRFVTDSGQEVVYESRAGLPVSGKSPGTHIPMLYNPANPEEARINSFIEVTLPWLLVLVMGGVMSGSGLAVLMYHLLQ